MKILHTADWHLGQNFYNYDRSNEHVFFFRQMVEIIQTEQPDLLLVAGDVFDSATPSIAIQRLYVQEILQLHEACHDMQIIITAGNHDSPSRLEMNNLLWESHHVQIIGTLEKIGNEVNWDKMILHVKQAWVAAVPYIYIGNYPGENIEPNARVKLFYNELLRRINLRRTADEPAIAVAHLALIDHSDNIVGKMEPISPDIFAPDYAYVALGHIHRPHHVNESRIRYAGSPFGLSFTETYEHSVTMVEFDGAQLTSIRKIALQELCPVRDLTPQPRTYDEILAAAHNFPADCRCYLRVKHLVNGFEHSNIYYDIQQQLEHKQAQLCLIEPVVDPTVETADELTFHDVNSFKKASPLEIAQLHYAQYYHTEMPDELIRCFKIATQKAEEK